MFRCLRVCVWDSYVHPEAIPRGSARLAHTWFIWNWIAVVRSHRGWRNVGRVFNPNSQPFWNRSETDLKLIWNRHAINSIRCHKSSVGLDGWFNRNKWTPFFCFVWNMKTRERKQRQIETALEHFGVELSRLQTARTRERLQDNCFSLYKFES